MAEDREATRASFHLSGSYAAGNAGTEIKIEKHGGGGDADGKINPANRLGDNWRLS
jgi:hypothetical protein